MFYVKKINQLPYSIEELAKHLESHFDEKMTWENRGAQGKGKGFTRSHLGWSLGHILPRNKFLDTKEDELKYFSLENLRPEWIWFNHFKGSMDPIEMKEWIKEENIFEKILEILESQI